ncbi:MAG: hypothetical protein ACI31F_00925 [Muribaculaceae bacterium]
MYDDDGDLMSATVISGIDADGMYTIEAEYEANGKQVVDRYTADELSSLRAEKIAEESGENYGKPENSGSDEIEKSLWFGRSSRMNLQLQASLLQMLLPDNLPKAT